MSVFLGPAGEFLDYDPNTGDLTMIEGARAEPGIYEIRVIVFDDSQNGSRAQEYIITIRVEDNL